MKGRAGALPAVLLSLGLAMVVASGHHFLGRRPPARPPPAAPASPPPPVQWPGPFSVGSHALPPREALPPGTIRILVLGDSVASFLGLALRYRQEELSAFVAERGVGSCSLFEAGTRPVPGQQVVETSCSAAWARDVAELRPDVTLIVLGGAFFNEMACDPAWLAAYEGRLLALVKAMGPGAGRVALTRAPYPMGRWRRSNVLERVDCFNGMLQRTAERARLAVLDLMGHVCPTRGCRVESQGEPIRPDGLHFDGTGAEQTARWVLRELRRIAAEGAPG
ncbi:MAG: hypothetical protein IT372_29390 [Polyangiaceae bacterium]|nr:hypothetical protein [Polyangiaceae bacterium]